MGYTQEQLAERMDLSANFIAHLERGSRKPSLDTLLSLSTTLEVPLDALVKPPLSPQSRQPKENPFVRRILRLIRDYPLPRLKALALVLEEAHISPGLDRPRRGRRRHQQP